MELGVGGGGAKRLIERRGTTFSSLLTCVVVARRLNWPDLTDMYSHLKADAANLLYIGGNLYIPTFLLGG